MDCSRTNEADTPLRIQPPSKPWHFLQTECALLPKPSSRYEPMRRCGDLRDLELLRTTRSRRNCRPAAPGLRRQAGFRARQTGCVNPLPSTHPFTRWRTKILSLTSLRGCETLLRPLGFMKATYVEPWCGTVGLLFRQPSFPNFYIHAGRRTEHSGAQARRSALFNFRCHYRGRRS